MSTLAPPEWLLVFADESHASSVDTAWSEHSELVEIDGLSVYLTRRPVKELLVVFPGSEVPIAVLRPPAPTPMFSHKRYGLPVGVPGAVAQWRYTCFGYLLGEQYRVTLTVSGEDLDASITPRSTPFTA